MNSIENESDLVKQEEHLQIKNAYGIDLNSFHTIGFINNTTLFYLVGCNLLTFDIENLKQKLSSFKSKGRIEFIKVTSDHRFALFVDIDQKNSNLFLIDLVEIDRKKFKKSILIENEVVNSISISNNMELIACLTSFPNWNLMIFSFNKFSLLAKVKAITSRLNDSTVEELSFFPNDNKRLLLIGNKLIKIYLYTKKGLKLIYNLDCDFSLIRHSWLNKNETISYDRYGNLFLIEPKQNSIRTISLNGSINQKDQFNQNFNEIEPSIKLSNTSTSLLSTSRVDKNESKTSFRKIYKPNKSLDLVKNRTHSNSNFKFNTSAIKCIVCALKGFFICYSNDDRVFFYNNVQKDLYNYSLSFIIKLKKFDKLKVVDKSFKEFILNILVNENQNILIAVTNRKIIYSCDLNDLFLNYNNNSIRQFEFEKIIDNYHSESITGIDYCIRKTLISTCSLDRWLILWNYDTNSIELKQNFDEDLFTVALHPSGLYLILCTTNSLKYMAIHLNSLKVISVLNVRSCTNCIFSNGGHIFAFVHGTIIQVYSSIRYNEIGSIKAQDMGKIKQLRFSKDDQYLMCCSMAGIIRIWNSQTLNLVCEITTKGLSYIGIGFHPNQEWLFLISTEKSIRQFQLPISDEYKNLIKSNSEAKLIRKLDTKLEENVTCIELSNSGKMICIGTNKGCIRVYLLPNGNYKEYKAHCGSINKICITFGDECLITSSDDGSILFWNIGNQLKEIYNDINQSNEEVLIDLEEYLTKSKIISKYEDKIKESRIETNFKLRMNELKFNIKQRELKSRFNFQLNDLNQKIEILKVEESTKENEFNLEFKSVVSNHLEKFESVYKMYTNKINNEETKNEILRGKIRALKDEIKLNEQKLAMTIEENEINQFKNIDRRLNLVREKHLAQMDIYQKQIDELVKYEYDFEEEFEKEIEKERNDFITKLSYFFTDNQTIRNNLNQLKFDYKLLNANIKDYLKNGYKPENDILELKNKIKELEDLEVKLKLDLTLKEQQILDKEKELYELSNESNKIERLNLELNDKIKHFIKNEFELLKLDNNQLSIELDETKKEIKHKILELNKLKYYVFNFKNRIRLKKRLFFNKDKFNR